MWLTNPVNKMQLPEVMMFADADGSGDIDFCEFVTLIAHKMKSESEGALKTDRLQAAFGVFVRVHRDATRERCAATAGGRARPSPGCNLSRLPVRGVRRTWTVQASSTCTRCGA